VRAFNLENIMEQLTAREEQIARLVTRGLTNRQIAAECGISPETVKRHLATIYDKLDMHGRVSLAIHVLQSRTVVEAAQPTGA
jgi:DNA-binding NarL/FixJ family response regulator